MSASVHVTARQNAACLLDDWINGRITNYQLEDAWPESDDQALQSIAQQLWLHYDDLRPEKINVSNLTWPVRRLLVCIRRFLSSKYEYEWPPFNFQTGNVSFWRSFLREVLPGPYQSAYQRNLEQFERFADSRYWPFRSRAQFASARKL
jgi:hypothetical protein